MEVVAYNDEKTKYKVVPRGRCSVCTRYVWSDQARVKDENGVYTHSKCPIRCGGHIDELRNFDAYWRQREKKWNSLFGKDRYYSVHSSLGKIATSSIAAYD
jgi:hypothetical protein